MNLEQQQLLTRVSLGITAVLVAAWAMDWLISAGAAGGAAVGVWNGPRESKFADEGELFFKYSWLKPLYAVLLLAEVSIVAHAALAQPAWVQGAHLLGYIFVGLGIAMTPYVIIMVFDRYKELGARTPLPGKETR